MSKKLKIIFLAFLLLFCSSSAYAETEQNNLKEKRIVLLGAVPVMSSFFFVLKQGDSIQNDLPLRFKNNDISHRIYNDITQVKRKNLPVYGFDSDVNIELLVKNRPDYIFTMDKHSSENLTKRNFNAYALAWRNDDDVKRIINFLAELLDAKEEAKRYLDYYESVDKTLKSKLELVALEDKPKVLCFDYKTMATSHRIIDSWIKKSGGVSVTATDRKLEKLAFSLEQILIWNPEIIILTNPNDVQTLYENKKFATIKAVKSKKVFVAPKGVHFWAYRTAELPLMQLWAAKFFHPKLFEDIDMNKEIEEFYKNLVGYKLTSQEIQEILYRPIANKESK